MQMSDINITNFFEELLTNLKCQRDTKAYIVSIYGKYKSAEFDMSKDSIALMFAQARNKQDFLTYQNIGDWLFYSRTMYPASLKGASENYYDNIAQLSYYNCYRMLNKKWKLYQQLADEFIPLSKMTRNILIKL